MFYYSLKFRKITDEIQIGNQTNLPFLFKEIGFLIGESLLKSINPFSGQGAGVMSPVETTVWLAIIGNVGLPMAITMYLFIRFEKKLGDLEKVITNLSETIKQLTNKQ